MHDLTKAKMFFEIVLFILAALSAAVAAITGFGIGSILTPTLALAVDTKLAVAAISFPHLVATGMRLWKLRSHIDRHVLLSFGITSAVGGLAGALLHNIFGGPTLTLIFGCLLIFAGFMGTTGLSEKLRFGRVTGWVAGALSGVFGGLVGNQGGIRAAAMLSFDISRDVFVATSTAIGIVVDMARMPVYSVESIKTGWSVAMDRDSHDWRHGRDPVGNTVSQENSRETISTCGLISYSAARTIYGVQGMFASFAKSLIREAMASRISRKR